MTRLSLKVVNETRGFVLYTGESLIDRKPIVCIGTLRTENAKTGNMVQTWILRADMKPTSAIFNGEDSSICGECPHRGEKGRGRSCYVAVHQAPNKVWDSWKRGSYSGFRPELVKNRLVRLGSYGDPAAVPYEKWQNLVSHSVGWTGYTHQWRTCDERFSQILMASCDSREEQREARSKGYRTFRVYDPSVDSVAAGEFSCPASSEAGYRLNCENCLACAGTRFGKVLGGNVAIQVHGRKAVVNSFRRNV